MKEKISWRGTWGVGDFMMALNACHLHAFKTNRQIELEMHWHHDPDHLHHFEDPETIIERFNYIHNFYHRKDDVKVTHKFNEKGRYYYGDTYHEQLEVRDKKRFHFQFGKYNDKPGGAIPDNDWLFREDCRLEMDRQKVVIWRPTFNAETPRQWKRLLTNDDWDGIIAKLRRAGLNITELTYRTPVSEAMYHINTCRFILCYDGMWHYIAKNFAKPMVVVSREGITKYHTPHAIRANPLKYEDSTSIHWWMENIPDMLGHAKKKAIEYEERMSYIYEEQTTD